MRDPVTVLSLVRAAAFLLVVCSLLACFRMPHWSLELLQHFRFQYLWAGVVLLLVAAYLRDYWSVGGLLAITALNGWLVLAWFTGTEQTPVAGTSVKIVHANVLSSNSEHHALIAFVKAEQPDVIFLQEVSPQWEAGLGELLNEWPHAYVESRPGNFGIAAYSKHPFDSIRHVDSPPLGYPTLIAALTIEQERVNLISTHPTIPLGASLSAARNQQMVSVAELAGSSAGPTIVSGDFNATVWDWRLSDFENASGLKNARRGFGVLPTWPARALGLRIPIDHVFVSDDIQVLKLETGPNIGSDHLPLVVTVSL
ncbi:MAG: endonuclease/exonuclease/phosphatase family protein [Pseudomonadota bacterium]